MRARGKGGAATDVRRRRLQERPLANQKGTLPRRDVLKALSALSLAAFVPVLSEARTRRPLYFSCRADNDLYRVASSSGIACSRYDHAEEAVAQAPQGSGLLILADRYPTETSNVDSKVYQDATRKRLRLYIEFPSSVPDLSVGKPQHVAYGRYHNILDRAVVASEAFAPALKRLQILALHNCIYVPVQSPSAELVLARVAGFDTAVYGLPQHGVHPVLFKHPNRNILVATTKLSEFEKGRYAPSEAWPSVWRWIFEWLAPKQRLALLRWTPVVHPAYGKNQRLPAEAEMSAFRSGVAWFSNAKLFVAPSWKNVIYESPAARGSVRDPSPSWPLGDGGDGVLEGFSSTIEWNGTQPVGWNLRNDCAGEVSMAMAFSGVVEKKSENGKIAANLNDFIYFNSALASGPRGDPRSPSFGLVGWSLPHASDVYYGDDNARSMLGTLAAAGLLQSNRWDEKVLRCLLANLRTTGVLGFRHNSLTGRELQKFGWRHFYEEKFINYHPHYEAYPWACFLMAYAKTHYAPFLDRTRTAIRMTMAAYPNNWRWTNGLQQERARMLLPLAWLIRLEDTPEHRGWLKRIAGDLISSQDKSGGIREEVGSAGEGQYGPPKSNDKYGTSEAPLLQQNGDPVCDLLYTTNFAFLGLHEAAAATHDPLYVRAENKLANFLCRIQVQSEKHPELAGGWFRAFDYKRWDYWASASDWGWGPWSLETGWTMSWITSVLAMRHLQTSLWEVTGRSDLGAHLQHLVSIMFS
jgi:hypothetical protein